MKEATFKQTLKGQEGASCAKSRALGALRRKSS